jgi:hypothetical protein
MILKQQFKLNSTSPKLSDLDLEKIRNLKNSMNLNRELDSISKTTSDLNTLITNKTLLITPYWLLGFVEGEGYIWN